MPSTAIPGLGVGLLEIDRDRDIVTPTVALPFQSPELLTVLELHPLDYPRQQELLRHVGAASV